MMRSLFVALVGRSWFCISYVYVNLAGCVVDSRLVMSVAIWKRLSVEWKLEALKDVRPICVLGFAHSRMDT